MTYPIDPPICKHKLLARKDLSVSRLEPKLEPKNFLEEAKSSATDAKHIADIYTYKEAPMHPKPIGSFLLHGFCSSTSIPISSSYNEDPILEGTMTCRMGVKNAAGKYRERLDSTNLQNSNNFALLIQQLRKEDHIAFFSCLKTQRCGFILPMENDGVPEESLDFCAFFFVASWEEMRAVLDGKQPSEHPENQFIAGDLWTPSAEYHTKNLHEGESWTMIQESSFPEHTSSSLSPTDFQPENFTNAKASLNSFHTDHGAAAADEFYSKLTRSLETRADSNLYHMRNYNGWVKATQISELDPFTDYGPSQNGSKKRKRTRHSLRVLDLACGKGGDIGKWVLHNRGISKYVGIDVARGSLMDAALRARKMKQLENCECIFICADLGSDVPGRPKFSIHKGRQEKMQKLLSWSLKDDQRIGDPEFKLKKGGGLEIDEKFDVVSIQFAIHYMMSSLKRARRFFFTVSQLLEIGGNLICTTIDSRVVLELMMNTGYNFHLDDSSSDDDLTISIGKGACELKFQREILKKIFLTSPIDSNDDCDALNPRQFGLEYAFTLVEGEDHKSGVGQAVDLPEWLTPIPTLERLANESGLVLEYASNFHEFFELRKDHILHPVAHSALYNMRVLNRSGSISEQEWDISRLYVAMKFRKDKEPQLEYEDSDEDESENESIIDDVSSHKLFNANNSGQIETNEMKINIRGGVIEEKLTLAMINAKRSCGKDWKNLSSDERKFKINEELQKL